MSAEVLILVAAAMLAVAFLYSAVGQAGASGYVAILTFTPLSPAQGKPVALVLNILVALISTIQFARSGHFSWRLFLPLALAALPTAYLGGFFHAPTPVFNGILGAVLIVSSVLLLVRHAPAGGLRLPSLPASFATGAGLGLLAGATATGGGVMLTPLLIFNRWALPRTAAAVSAPFILVNSIAALVATMHAGWQLPEFTWMLAVAVAIGGLAGAFVGSRVLSERSIRLLLAAVLFIAGVRLLASLIQAAAT